MIASIGEPSEVVETPDAPQEGAEQPSTVSEAAQSGLPDDTELEIELADGSKQTVKLGDLRQNYVDRDRHRKAADQKFTEADRRLKSAVGAAVQDPNAFMEFVEKNRGDFKRIDYAFKMLEENADPQVIDRLAAILTKKLEAEKAEQEMSPADKRVRELEEQNKKLQAQWEREMDSREEQALFDGVKAAVEAAGLNPTPMIAVMALEIVSEARAQGVNLNAQQAAQILKQQFSGAAEKLFNPPAATQPRDAATGQFQTKAKAAPGAADQGMAAAARRQAKQDAPRVSVVKNAKKEAPKEDRRQSFLEAMMEHAYSSIK